MALLAAAAVILGAGWVTHRAALHSGLEGQRETAAARMTLLVAALDATVERFRYLPTVLAQADVIQDVYRDPSPAAVAAANEYLRLLNDAAGSFALFVMDVDGVAIAASNFGEESSFVGRSYAFRPYYTEAQLVEQGRYYAVGATTGQPGYFLWHSVADSAGSALGVAVVKLDLQSLEQDWRDPGGAVALADRNGVVFLTDRPDWRYRPVAPLDSEQLRILRETRQYGSDVDFGNPLFSDARTEHGARIVRVRASDGRLPNDYVLFTRELPAHGWTMSLLFELAPVHRDAVVVAIAVMLALLALALVSVATRQRRQMLRARLDAHRALEQAVRERTAELAATNERLSAEVHERVRTEEHLVRAQDDLVHAAKMASLGQALAGVAHEINQSLAALTTYLAGARVLLARGDRERVLSNLDLIASIADRMAALTQHLKSFSRKDSASRQATDLVAALRASLTLVEYRLHDEQVALVLDLPERAVYVNGSPVRLEQVMVNLLSNALDAMTDRPRRHLSVRIGCRGTDAELEVADTGQGIARESLALVFDPFYTTKEVGRGLGLGLSISYGIIRDMGGEISVESEPGAGTTFRVRLPLAAGEAESRHELDSVA